VEEFKLLEKLIEGGTSGFVSDIVTFVVIAIIVKKYLINGTAVFLRDAVTRYLDHESEQLKIQTATGLNLTAIAMNLEKINEKLVTDRNHYDEYMGGFQASLEGLEGKIEQTLMIAKKRKTDWTREETP